MPPARELGGDGLGRLHQPVGVHGVVGTQIGDDDRIETAEPCEEPVKTAGQSSPMRISRTGKINPTLRPFDLMRALPFNVVTAYRW